MDNPEIDKKGPEMIKTAISERFNDEIAVFFGEKRKKMKIVITNNYKYIAIQNLVCYIDIGI